MGVQGKKRVVDGQEETSKRIKRHKKGGVAGTGPAETESLPWSKVSIPQLDDAEGFFDLEEISDVEVVRDTQSGNISYKVSSDNLVFYGVQ